MKKKIIRNFYLRILVLIVIIVILLYNFKLTLDVLKMKENWNMFLDEINALKNDCNFIVINPKENEDVIRLYSIINIATYIMLILAFIITMYSERLDIILYGKD